MWRPMCVIKVCLKSFAGKSHCAGIHNLSGSWSLKIKELEKGQKLKKKIWSISDDLGWRTKEKCGATSESLITKCQNLTLFFSSLLPASLFFFFWFVFSHKSQITVEPAANRSQTHYLQNPFAPTSGDCSNGPCAFVYTFFLVFAASPRSHRETAELVEAFAGRALNASRQTLDALMDLLLDNSTEEYIGKLTERWASTVLRLAAAAAPTIPLYELHSSAALLPFTAPLYTSNRIAPLTALNHRHPLPQWRPRQARPPFKEWDV